MIRRYIFLLFLIILSSSLMAQLPDGSQAPDFTVTDINGQTHTLSNYLDEGKTVFLKFFATWCGFCWNHHQTNALNELYEQYGPPGTDEVMVILIEGDSRTNEGCITNSGCNANTYGDWTDGKTNPIADDAAVNSLYRVGYFPTIYGICPDGILYQVGQKTSSWYYNWHLNNCALKLSLDEMTDASCYEKADGQILVTASGGMGSYTFNWSNGATTNENRNIPAGTYSVTLSDGASTVEGGPYVIEQPEEMVVRQLEVEDASCVAASNGQISLDIEGGVGPYFFDWEDGPSTRDRNDLLPGTYFCTVSDQNDCRLETGDILVKEKIVPPPQMSNDTTVCASSMVQLWTKDGVEYLWSNGSSERSIQVSPDASSSYSVTVTYASGCEGIDSVEISVVDNPDLGMDRIYELGCSEGRIKLTPENFPGPDHEYSWEVLNGGQPDSTVNPWEIEVSTTGLYSLTATSAFLSCSSSVNFQVLPDENLPVVDIRALSELDCNNFEIQLDGSGSSQGEDFSFEWSAEDPNAEIKDPMSLQPTIQSPGVYELTVLNESLDCENKQSIEIKYGNLRHPDVSIGFEVIGDDIQFYNASRDEAERFYWVLPNGNSSIEESPILNRNALEGDVIEVCLNATNQCGNSSLVCQTIDLTDESYYFEGVVADQFGEPLNGIEILNSDGMAVSTSSGGKYQFSGLDQNQSFEVHSPISHDYQSEDINAADLNMLWQGLLDGKNWTDMETLAGDLNGDRLISLIDLIILQRELLSGQLDLGGQWLTFTSDCIAAQGEMAVNNCPGFYDVHLLQASRLNNDFVAIQKADLDKENNQFGLITSSRYNYDGGSIMHMMNGWHVLALKVSDLPDDVNGVFANGVALQDHEYRLEDGELFILKLMEETEESVELSFGRDAHIESNVDFRLFPNPAADRIQLSFNSESTSDGTWGVTDYTGRTLLFSQMNYNKGTNVVTIQTDRLFPGIFFMAIEIEGQVFRKKFVVSKK